MIKVSNKEIITNAKNQFKCYFQLLNSAKLSSCKCNGFSHNSSCNSSRSKKHLTTFKPLSTSDETKVDSYVRTILENNKKWVKETKEKDPNFFIDLAKPQKPKFLYIGCSDSRVPANQILGLG
jgi:hypothetical protein